MSAPAAPATPATQDTSARPVDPAFARYRSAEGLDRLRRNPVIDGLLAHRSVRAYLPDALPDGTIETLVAAAQSGASSSNLQVWSVVAVEDAARKARLAALAGDQRHIVEAPLLLIWLIDFDRLTRLGAFQRDQGMTQADWTQLALRRTAGPPATAPLSLAQGIWRPEDGSGAADEVSGEEEPPAAPRDLGPDTGQADPAG